VQDSIDFSGSVDDLFRHGIDGTGPALLNEGRHLPDGIFRVEPSHDLVASDNGKSEVIVLAQVRTGIA